VASAHWVIRVFRRSDASCNPTKTFLHLEADANHQRFQAKQDAAAAKEILRALLILR
jgi:hypothetical protein